jgi:hypothetical protein
MARDGPPLWCGPSPYPSPSPLPSLSQSPVPVYVNLVADHLLGAGHDISRDPAKATILTRYGHH